MGSYYLVLIITICILCHSTEGNTLLSAKFSCVVKYLTDSNIQHNNIEDNCYSCLYSHTTKSSYKEYMFVAKTNGQSCAELDARQTTHGKTVCIILFLIA